MLTPCWVSSLVPLPAAQELTPWNRTCEQWVALFHKGLTGLAQALELAQAPAQLARKGLRGPGLVSALGSGSVLGLVSGSALELAQALEQLAHKGLPRLVPGLVAVHTVWL